MEDFQIGSTNKSYYTVRYIQHGIVYVHIIHVYSIYLYMYGFKWGSDFVVQWLDETLVACKFFFPEWSGCRFRTVYT